MEGGGATLFSVHSLELTKEHLTFGVEHSQSDVVRAPYSLLLIIRSPFGVDGRSLTTCLLSGHSLVSKPLLS